MLTVKIIFCVNEEKRKEERKKREREGGGRDGERRKGEPSEAMRRKDLFAELGINVSSTHEIRACF